VAGPGSDRHASRRLADALRAGITSGAHPAGARLPSYRQLRDEHQVALNTAQAAIRLLAAEGLVEIRPARGAYVRDEAAVSTGPVLRSELADLQAALRRSRQELLAAESAVASLITRLPREEPAR
jgi:DNA-binding FadR family transcriptional regulator